MLRNRAFQITVLTVLITSVMLGISVATADDASPATASATTSTTTTTQSVRGDAAPAKPADIAPDAAPLLQKVSDAYKNLKSVALAGTLTGEFDVDGQKANEKIDLTASFAAPNRFRHAMKDDLLVGNTGEQMFLFEGGRKLYRMTEAKKEKTSVTELPDPFDRILLDQNLSLALAVSNDPAADLGKLYTKIAKSPADITIDGKAYPALLLTNDHETLTLALDPQTSLVRRATFDIAKAMKKRGAQDVAKAVLTMDYGTTTPGVETKAEQFAWAPPPGARDVATVQTPGEGDLPALAMVGKPAPDFSLKDLNGKEVKLTDLKGNVWVLDYWATWCPPCVAAMPSLNELAGDMKQQGVKVVAMNADEEKDLVAGFINSRKLNNLIVLLDPESKVGEQYKANELLPTTMVIGKDGTIRKVITTGGSQTEKDLKAAIQDALRASK
jgi:peroxiredoxin